MRARDVSSALTSIVVMLCLIDPAAARPKSQRACSAEIGQKASRQLVRDCRDSSPAAPALCRPETPCGAMRQMILDACRAPGSEAKPVCSEYEDEEDDDDEDE